MTNLELRKLLKDDPHAEVWFVNFRKRTPVAGKVISVRWNWNDLSEPGIVTVKFPRRKAEDMPAWLLWTSKADALYWLINDMRDDIGDLYRRTEKLKRIMGQLQAELAEIQKTETTK